MGYRIQLDRRLSSERRRIAIEQLDKCLEELGDEAVDVHQRVRQLSRRARKIRALARLFRPVDERWYRRANRRLGRLVRDYADLRQAGAAVATFDRVASYFDRQINVGELLPIRGVLLRERTRLAWEETEGERLAALQATLLEIRDEVRQWPDVDVAPALVVTGFAKTYRRGRRAMRAVVEGRGDADWEEWHRRVKYQRHQLALLGELWPALMGVWESELRRLGDLTGDHEDLVGLRALLATRIAATDVEPRSVEALLGLMHQRSLALRAEAVTLGERLFADSSRVLARRLSSWFSAV